MYQLNLNQEEKELLENLVCQVHHSKFDSVSNAKGMLRYPLTKEAMEAYQQVVSEFDTLSSIHDILHDLKPINLDVNGTGRIKSGNGISDQVSKPVAPRDPDAIPTIIDPITDKPYLRLDLDMLLRVYSKLAIYKEQIVNENPSNFKANKLKSVVEAHHYIGNLIRAISK